MTYSISVAPAAARQVRKFDPQVRRRIQAASTS
jgi:mRNA interferase RelE/StbE